MPVQMKKTMITSLSASLGEFTVSFQMMPQDSTLIIAAVSNNKAQQNFHVIIDGQYMSSQQEFFRSVFDEPQDVFEELVAHFQDIVIEDGLLKFSYNYGGLKKKKKVMSINLFEGNSSTVEKKVHKSQKSIFNRQRISMIQENKGIEFSKIMEEQESDLEKIVKRIINRLGWEKIRDEKSEQQKEKRRLLDLAIEERINKINERLLDIEGKIRVQRQSDSKEEDNWSLQNETIMRIDQYVSEEINSLKTDSLRFKQRSDQSIQQMTNEIQTMREIIQRCERQSKSTNLALQSFKQQSIKQINQENMKFEEQIGKCKEDMKKIREQTEFFWKEMKVKVQNIQQIKDKDSRTQVSQGPKLPVKQETEGSRRLEEQIQKNKEISQQLKEKTEKQFKQVQTSIQRMQEKLIKFETDIKDTVSRFQTIQRQHQQAEQIRALQSRLYSQSVYQSLSIIKSQQDLHTQKLKQLDTIGHHLNNSHKQFYKLLNNSNVAAKIVRSGQVGWYNFVNRFQICLNHKFTIKINKLSKNALIVGFCTEGGLSKINNHQSLEAAYYNCSGYLIEDGASKFLNVRFTSGDTIECYADLKNNRIAWLTKGHEFSSCNIPKQMRNKPIFFSIMMYWTSDEVDLFI